MNPLQHYGTGLIAVVALSLSLCACHQGSPATAPAAAASDANEPANSVQRNTSGAAAYTVPSKAVPATKRSLAGLMRELNASEQARVRDLYQRIGGPSMDDATPAQTAWMQARHYPMPADVARVMSMSEAELKATADTGDTVARILYVARLLNEYSEHASANTPTSETIRRRARAEVNRVLPQVLASGSPYAGYLYAAKSRLMYPGKFELNAPAQLAGLVWASKFGDTRATLMLTDPKVQAVNGPTAAAEISVMLGMAIFDNPRLFSAHVSSIPMPDH